MDLILASNSPRRVELLQGMGYEFRVIPAQVDELHEESGSLLGLTMQNAALKAAEVARRHPSALVIGADTLVSVNGSALGKPADLDEARRMLRMLSGTQHQVCTAVCLHQEQIRRRVSFEEITEVEFLPLTDGEIETYLTLTNPLDKAGSYGIQDHGERIVKGIRGSLHNVIGLPTERLARELAAWKYLTGLPTA